MGRPQQHLRGDYQTRLQTIIGQTRADAGWNIPWYVAEASYGSSTNLTAEEPIVSAQRSVFYNVANTFPGPVTDDFHQEGKLHDEVHFNAVGLADHAAQWEQVLGGIPPIEIKNGDLESNPALADGGIQVISNTSNLSPSLIGWRNLNASLDAVADGFCGYYNPDNSYYVGASDSGGGVLPNMSGRQVAFISDSSPGAGFLQTRRAMLTGGRTYTLKVSLGVRGNTNPYGGATLQILAGGTVLASKSLDRAALDPSTEETPRILSPKWI